MPHHPLIRCLSVVGAVALGILSAKAQEAAPGASGPTNSVELEAFFDGVMSTALDTHNIAGGVVAVVRDGALFFAKGYGFADLEQRIPVQADTTLFRIGSISKLFVWTAVMQLVEQGQLDLNADINTYLKDFKIPATFPQPVTLRHLMTHSAGFEERWVGMAARDAASLRPLAEVLAEQLPARVRPPGELASYSNHGSALAAHVVECVSGLSWNDYVEKRLLAPLAMKRTTFRQPVPEPLAALLAKGYHFADGESHALPFDWLQIPPAGSACATANDMAHFMIAHLQGGQFGENRILSEATARAMQSELFRHAPLLNPMAHGFIDQSANGQRVIGHGGDLAGFHSMLALLPEHRLGLFVSLNSDSEADVRSGVLRSFLNRYFPAGDVPIITPEADAQKRLARFAGHYRTLRYTHTDFTRLAGALDTLAVTVTSRGELKIQNKKNSLWVQTGPLAFREKHGLRTLAFREGPEGRITHLFLGYTPHAAFERVARMDAFETHRSLFLACLTTFLSTILFFPLAALARRHYRVTLPAANRVPGWARWLGWLGAVTFVTVAWFVQSALGGQVDLATGIPSTIRLALMLTQAGAVLSALAALAAIWIWWRRQGTVWGRVGCSLVALALAITTWQAWHWNLMGSP